MYMCRTMVSDRYPTTTLHDTQTIVWGLRGVHKVRLSGSPPFAGFPFFTHLMRAQAPALMHDWDSSRASPTPKEQNMPLHLNAGLETTDTLSRSAIARWLPLNNPPRTGAAQRIAAGNAASYTTTPPPSLISLQPTIQFPMSHTAAGIKVVLFEF